MLGASFYSAHSALKTPAHTTIKTEKLIVLIAALDECAHDLQKQCCV